MVKRLIPLGALVPLLLFLATGALAADKLRMGTSLRFSVFYDLIALAGEEKAFWKENGLAVEWVPFRGGTDQQRAMAAAAIEVALSDISSFLVAASAGVPIIMVADMGTPDDFAIVVRGDLPIKEAKELKGTRLGILRAGGASYVYGLFLGKALGLEKDIKLVAGGGITEELAAIKAGAMEGRVTSLAAVMPVMVKGELKAIVHAKDYLPKEWITRMVSARRDLVENQPEVVKRFVKAFLQVTNFMMANADWNVAKMKTHFKYTDEVGRAVLPLVRFTRDGRIEKKALDNVVAFFVEYGVLAKEKVPPADKLFTNRFTE